MEVTMKRTIKLTADDREVRVKIQATVEAPARFLAADELNKIQSRLTRALAQALDGLPYTDFGIDNIRVK